MSCWGLHLGQHGQRISFEGRGFVQSQALGEGVAELYTMVRSLDFKLKAMNLFVLETVSCSPDW